MDIRSCRVDLVNAIALLDGDLTVIVVPEIGGKICSIQWRGREFVTRNELRPTRYEAPFAEFDASGFDECLPSIGPCAHPVAPWQGIDIPDHGEVWSIPWIYEVDGDQLRLKVHGVRFPFSFEKAIILGGDERILLQYHFYNHSPFPFPFLWSAHPLLAIQPGWRIHLPEGTNVVVDWSRDARLGEPFTEHAWPATRDREGTPIDMSLILDRAAGTAEKLYTTRLDVGWCALHDPKDGFYIAMLFDPAELPYVGLSINFGGWPVEGVGYYNLGLEPCNGFPDRLDIALKRGSCVVAPPYGQVDWRVEFYLGRCASLPAEIERLQKSSAAA